MDEQKDKKAHHFNATLEGIKSSWEVDVWDAVEQVSKHSPLCKSLPKNRVGVTQILIANLRWIKDFSLGKDN